MNSLITEGIKKRSVFTLYKTAKLQKSIKIKVKLNDLVVTRLYLEHDVMM